MAVSAGVVADADISAFVASIDMSSQSRCSALFNANKVLNCQNLILNLPILNLICLKHRRLRIEVEIEVELAVFMVLKPLISSQILKKGYRAVKRVFVWKVVQFEDKSTSYQYFRDPRDF